MGGPIGAKAGESGEVWHSRSRKGVPPDDLGEVSAGSGASAESPLGSTDLIPGQWEPQRTSRSSCCQAVGQSPCREVGGHVRLGLCCGNAPASTDAMESLPCHRVPVLWSPMVGGKGSQLF